MKFDRTRLQFRDFLNQVRLVIQMHPSWYTTDVSRVGLVGMLLSALAWFAPLLEKRSPLLIFFEEFLSEFKACFGDTDIIRTINKIRWLCQGDRPTSANAADIRLLASDIPWDDQALLVEQFHYSLRNDVKDLLLTFPEEPKSLT